MGTQFVYRSFNRTCSFASPKTLRIAFDARKNEVISGFAEKEKVFPLDMVVPRYFHSVTEKKLAGLSGLH